MTGGDESWKATSARKNRRRKQRPKKAVARPVPVPGQGATELHRPQPTKPVVAAAGPEITTCIACPNCCTAPKWALTENQVGGERHQVYFEVHKDIPVDVPCYIFEAPRYHGHPLVSYRFMKSIRASLYDRPEVKTVLGNGITVYSRRLIRTIFRDRTLAYKIELMVIEEDLEIYELNGWVGGDGQIPDIVLNAKWQEGHVCFQAEEGAGERIFYL